MSKENHVGNKICQLREAKEMSVEELAEASQSSVELVKQLEDGALVPSLTPLLKIARALGVRLGTFLDDMPQSGPAIVRAGLLRNAVRFSGKAEISTKSSLEFYSLASDKADRQWSLLSSTYILLLRKTTSSLPMKEKNSCMSFQGKSRSSTGKMFKG